MSSDKIPNIRINVAKAIFTVRKKIQGMQVGPVENSIETELL